MPIKTSIGTYLLIIIAKSLIGSLGDLPNQPIQWTVLLPYTALSISGIFIGSYISRYVYTERLKTCFGWFIICISVFIIIKNL
ncbi:sulfite exporter TauE/SafE family protein [Telluribacter humicola]|uniref:sulfite exporter TauE/SafE family protein n=1 Tax=Telluribacter humicola TaxID=1720261 RepID=UPI001E38C00B|nr:sulfite exporter TauE/SafE family protein [Telluribacter humicola]